MSSWIHHVLMRASMSSRIRPDGDLYVIMNTPWPDEDLYVITDTPCPDGDLHVITDTPCPDGGFFVKKDEFLFGENQF